MITATVSENLEAIIQVLVQGLDGEVQKVEALLDTGYNGFLTLAPSQIADLDLPYITQGAAVLGNGQPIEFDLHRGIVVWDDISITGEIAALGDFPLVGMSLLHGYHLEMDAIEGNAVVIQKLP